MKITELYIKAFGKLRGMKITIIDGMNIFYGENESGKSTIMAFILSMFYGLGKGEQRHRYEPWDGGRISGSISFEHDGKDYVLRRQFGVTKAADKTELWCVTTGEQVDLPERCEPGQYLLGINKETFLNSVYIGQAGVPIQGDNNEILAKLTNLAASGDETASRTEISGRLSEASAHLRSRRNDAILPTLEKERSELLEQRSVIVKRSEEADALRDDIVKLQRRSKRLTEELSELEKHDKSVTQLRRLRELDNIINRKKSLDDAKEKYDALHNGLFSGENGLTPEYLATAQELLDEYKKKQVIIQVKQNQLTAVDEKMAALDTEPLKKMRILKKYKDRISAAREDYATMRDQREQLEREIAHKELASNDSKLSRQNVILASGAIVAVLILLGFLNKVFFIFAIVAAIIAGGYLFIQSRELHLDGSFSENIALQNLTADMQRINTSMSDVLTEMDVPNMDALDRAMHKLRDLRDKHDEISRERDVIINELDGERQQVDEIMAKLKEHLAPFTQVKSDEQAIGIFSELNKRQCEYAALEARYKAEQESFDIALAGNEYEYIETEAEIIREELGDRAGLLQGESLESYDENLEKYRTELSESHDALVKDEAALEYMNSDPQELNQLNDQIKLLTDRIDHYEFELSAVEEAQSALSDAFESMQKDFGPMINFRAGKIVDALTGGKYSSVIISESLSASVADQCGSIHGTQALSGGTVDQIYLALRLAISGILSEENLPLLLDDAFAQYDDKRMSDALYYLAKENGKGRLGQVLLFTCHERVKKAAEEIGLHDSIISM